MGLRAGRRLRSSSFRFREERARGTEKLEAISATGRTASRAVLFSGSAFVIALTGCCSCPTRSCAASRSAPSSSASRPCLRRPRCSRPLALLGDRVNAGRLPFVGRSAAGEGRFWGPDRRPRAAASARQPVVTSAVLVACPAGARPAHRLGRRPHDPRLVSLQARLPRARARARCRHRRLGRGRRRRRHDGEPRSGGGRSRARSAAADPRFRSPETTFGPNGDIAVVEALVAGDSRDEAVQAIEELRNDVVPAALDGSGARAYVTGETAEIVDYRELMEAGCRSCSSSCSASASSCSRSRSARSSPPRRRSCSTCSRSAPRTG